MAYIITLNISQKPKSKNYSKSKFCYYLMPRSRFDNSYTKS